MTGNTARDIVNSAAARAGKDRAARVAAILLAVCLGVAGIYFGPRIAAQGKQIDTLTTQSQDLQRAAVKNGDIATQLGDQIRALGATPVVDPSNATVPAANVDPAALRQAARSAVEDYCATRDQCRGANGQAPDFDALTNAVLARIPTPKDGAPGKDAPTPDVVGAVAAYCGQDTDPCRGQAGTKGDTGDTGATGATGAAGPACPDGYELRDAVITAPDQTTYQGKACVDPSSSSPPSTDPPTSGG